MSEYIHKELPAPEPDWNGGKKAVDRLRKAISQTETVESPWISVYDRLPTKEDGGETECVLVIGDITLKAACVKWTLANPDSWYSHWTPIPALPVEPAQAAFEGWYVPSKDNHRSEQQTAFVAGYKAAQEGADQ